MSGLRSTTTNWNSTFLASEQCSGDGLIVECTVQEVRAHSVFIKKSGADQADNLPSRYNAFWVSVQRAYPRIYKDGYEIEYMANIPVKKSYIAPSILSHEQLCSMVGRGASAAMPDEYLPSVKHLFPTTEFFEFWMDVGKAKAKDVEPGHELRIRTHGSSVFIDGLEILNAKAADELTGGWTNTILTHAEGDAVPGDDQDGCDSDEWD